MNDPSMDASAVAAASVMDMWYGSRDMWFDVSLPFAMNLSLSEPAYRDHNCLDYIAQFGTHPDVEMDWIGSDRDFHECVEANNRQGDTDPLGDVYGRNE